MANFGVSKISDSQIPEIEERLSKGQSLVFISASLCVTKNTLIGFMYRRGIKYNHTRNFKKAAVNRAIPEKIIKLKFKRKPLPKEKTLSHIPCEWPPAEGRCRDVVGSPQDHPIHACGLPCVHGSSWCDAHYRAYVDVRVYAPRIVAVFGRGRRA